jgi:hypothetical protein
VLLVTGCFMRSVQKDKETIVWQTLLQVSCSTCCSICGVLLRRLLPVKVYVMRARTRPHDCPVRHCTFNAQLINASMHPTSHPWLLWHIGVHSTLQAVANSWCNGRLWHAWLLCLRAVHVLRVQQLAEPGSLCLHSCVCTFKTRFVLHERSMLVVSLLVVLSLRPPTGKHS